MFRYNLYNFNLPIRRFQKWNTSMTIKIFPHADDHWFILIRSSFVFILFPNCFFFSIWLLLYLAWNKLLEDVYRDINFEIIINVLVSFSFDYRFLFCETQWPWPNLFSPSWLIQWSMGEGVLYNLFFTEWRHCVSQNEVWGRGCYIALFSASDVTAFFIIVNL